MVKLRGSNELTESEINDLQSSVNVIVTHITDGNNIEGEVTKVMGGHIYELSSDRIKREAQHEVHEQLDPIIERQRQELESAVQERDSAVHERDALNKEVAELRAKLAAFEAMS